MVRRTRLMIVVLLGIWVLAGCSTTDKEDKTMDRNEQSTAAAGGQSISEENKQDAADMIRDLLGCSRRTAQSIEDQCHMAGIGEIRSVEKKEDIYTILELTTEEGKYYLYLTDGFFLEQIRKDAEDGEQIYMSME